MSILDNFRKHNWLLLIVIFLALAMLLWLAPAEQTLGTGIKSVYVHVALTWTGMTYLLLAALLGLIVAASNKRELFSWASSLAWVALAMFAAGLLMSIVAAGVNWGAIFWQEPRTNSALQILAVGLIVQGIDSWPIPFRLKGVLLSSPAFFLVWSLANTPLVLHPDSAARTSPSSAIRFTFVAMYMLCSLLAAWIVLRLQRRKSSPGETGWAATALSPRRER